NPPPLDMNPFRYRLMADEQMLRKAGFAHKRQAKSLVQEKFPGLPAADAVILTACSVSAILGARVVQPDILLVAATTHCKMKSPCSRSAKSAPERSDFL